MASAILKIIASLLLLVLCSSCGFSVDSQRVVAYDEKYPSEALKITCTSKDFDECYFFKNNAMNVFKNRLSGVLDINIKKTFAYSNQRNGAMQIVDVTLIFEYFYASQTQTKTDTIIKTLSYDTYSNLISDNSAKEDGIKKLIIHAMEELKLNIIGD